jgi:hypothetical protein
MRGAEPEVVPVEFTLCALIAGRFGDRALWLRNEWRVSRMGHESRRSLHGFLEELLDLPEGSPSHRELTGPFGHTDREDTIGADAAIAILSLESHLQRGDVPRASPCAAALPSCNRSSLAVADRFCTQPITATVLVADTPPEGRVVVGELSLKGHQAGVQPILEGMTFGRGHVR